MNKKRGRRRKKKAKTDLDTVIADFVACGRCSFFLTGYRVLHGKEKLREEAETSGDEWLVLTWDHDTRQLVQRSYGSRLDIEFYYYDGRCPECQRRYVIGAKELPIGAEEEEWTVEQGQEAPEPSTLHMALTDG